MTNKYTLKDMYKWSIERGYIDSRNMVLSVEYDLPDKEHVFISKRIHSPDPDNAQAEIIKAMDQIKQENPEVFVDHENITDVFNDALKRIESLSDDELFDFSMSIQAIVASDDD